MVSKIKQFYINLGHPADSLEEMPDYLADLALRGAAELNRYSLDGLGKGFDHLEDFKGLLVKYQLKDSDSVLTNSNFPYTSLWRAMKKGGKDISTCSEVALEMRLLRAELEHVIENSERLSEMTDFLVSFSRELRAEESRLLPARVA